MKRYAILLDHPKGFGRGTIGAGQGLQKDVRVENNVRTGGLHGRQSFAFLTRRLLRTLKEAIDFIVAHPIKTTANGLKEIVERSAVSIDKRLQILLWRLAQRTRFLLRDAEVFLIKCYRAS
jgi:hypothetical protein